MNYKIKCSKCKQNYQLVTRPTRFVVCYECQKPDLKGEITDPKMKKLLDIPEQFYKDNLFLRDIKIKYLRFGDLSEKQIAAFEKVVDKMQKAVMKD
ncbi:hypothetical protein H8D36_07435 [archaeon]|nr:hypothetical protein [archaeon]MBL7057692.1 hypothetical protein [Candidatus Woesearchaeota archaeon]